MPGNHEAPYGRKTNNGQETLLILLAVFVLLIALVGIVVGILNLLPREQAVLSEDQTSPQSAAPQEKLTDTIALPQFAWIDLQADATEQSMTFDNPSQNFAAFRVSIVLDGETLWESETLRPGDTSAPVVLSRPLAKGEYEAHLVYTCFTNDEAERPLNGADSPILLKVK